MQTTLELLEIIRSHRLRVAQHSDKFPFHSSETVKGQRLAHTLMLLAFWQLLHEEKVFLEGFSPTINEPDTLHQG